MCRCTPAIRTPFCGKPGCQWPEQVGYSGTQARPPNTLRPTQSGVPLLHPPPQASEAREAAQQLFEASVESYQGSDVGRLIFVTGCLEKWPWLRPNRWMKEGDG